MKKVKKVYKQNNNKINNNKNTKISNNFKYSSRQFFKVPESEVCISFKNLSVFYGNTKVIKKFSCVIPKNKIIAIIGKSGCGKSTLIRCINRLNDYVPGCHIEGEIYYNNENINSPKTNITKLRANVGMVFQKPSPFPMSIFNNVAYGPKVHGVRNKKELSKLVRHALKRSDIYNEVKNDLNVNALSLSGGQQQKICIARAIALEPEVILFDEPTSALDPISVENIEKLIKQLSLKYTIIIITHSLRQAKRISDYVMFLKNGSLKEYNKTVEIFKNPKSPSTKKYLDYELKH